MNGPTLFVFVGGGSYTYPELNEDLLINNDWYIHIVDPIMQDAEQDPDLNYEPIEKKIEYLENLIQDPLRYQFVRSTYAYYTEIFETMIQEYIEVGVFFEKIFIMIFASEAYDESIEIENPDNGIYLIDLTKSLTKCLYIGNEFINLISLSNNANFNNFLIAYNSLAYVFEDWYNKELYIYREYNNMAKEFCSYLETEINRI